jgi:hypothetical protein
LHEILTEIDDITGATLGSITLATMCKLVGRRGDFAKQASAVPH